MLLLIGLLQVAAPAPVATAQLFWTLANAFWREAGERTWIKPLR